MKVYVLEAASLVGRLHWPRVLKSDDKRFQSVSIYGETSLHSIDAELRMEVYLWYIRQVEEQGKHQLGHKLFLCLSGGRKAAIAASVSHIQIRWTAAQRIPSSVHVYFSCTLGRHRTSNIRTDISFVLKMCGLKCYVVAKEGGEMADFYYDSHILGTKLQAYLFDPDIEAEDVSTPDSTSTEYMEISPEIIEELPNLQELEAEEHRNKKHQDSLPSSDEEEDEDEDEEDGTADEDEEGNKDGLVRTEDEEDSECDSKDEEDEASEPEAVPLVKNSQKRHKLIHAPESTDGEREEAQHSPPTQKSLSDVGIMEIEAAVGPEIAEGNYLAPGTDQLQAATTENEEANAEAFSAMQIGFDPIGPNQEQLDDRDGLLEATSETEYPSSGTLPSNTETMEVSPPQVSGSHEGGRNSGDAFANGFLGGSLVNPEAHLHVSEKEKHRQVAVLGMAHRMDESSVHHPDCPCLNDESGDDSPTQVVGTSEEVVDSIQRQDKSLDAVVVARHGDPVVGDSGIAPVVASHSSISLIVLKRKPADTPLQPTQYKVGGSFEDAITIDSDDDDDVPSEEPNITSVVVVEEGPAAAAVEGAEKKVSPWTFS
jgi:hypothetical protein